MRRHPECKKPIAAVHLAMTILRNVDEMQIYDVSDLLLLDKLVAGQDGEKLTI